MTTNELRSTEDPNLWIYGAFTIRQMYNTLNIPCGAQVTCPDGQVLLPHPSIGSAKSAIDAGWCD